MGRLAEYAQSRGLRFDKESDFTKFIYRMERDYDLPTTVQTVSIGLPDGTPVIVASASPPVEPLKSIHLKLMGGHQTWHLHAGEQGLILGKAPLTVDRLHNILDSVFRVRAGGTGTSATDASGTVVNRG
jgi:hypothetical protein